MNVGENIKRIRETILVEKQLSNMDLAEKSGVTYAALRLIEGGKCQPTVTTLVKIAEALNCPVSELVAD